MSEEKSRKAQRNLRKETWKKMKRAWGDQKEEKENRSNWMFRAKEQQ